MSTEQLNKAWAELSLVQQQAAEWDQAPLLVLAGPGSGKTRVLTCRIARILDLSRDKNFRVLGLTFTNKAADEMRTRVATYVPGQEGRLFLGTFHSFCADILRQHGAHLKINPNFNIYALQSDLQAVLNDAVEDAKKACALVSDLDKKTLAVIQHLKSRLILPEECHNVFEDKEFDKRMSFVYLAYEAQLNKRNALDFNSLILKTYQLFKKFPAFAKRYRVVYPYICIDEFQDTNHAQYNLVRVFAGDQYKNIFVVADDDQIIYQWNGASHKRIDDYLNDFHPTVIQLPMNYRCPPEVVALANNLIRHNFLRASDKKPLEAFRPSPGTDAVRLLPCFPSFEDEADFLAADVRERHSKHLSAVVILARTRKLLEGAELALRASKVPSVISQRKDEFESTPLVWLHSTLLLASDRQDNKSLEAVCGTFAQLTELEVDPEDVLTQAKPPNRDYLHHWVKIALKKNPNILAREAINQVLRCLVESRDFRSFSKFALNWFEKLARQQNQNGPDPTSKLFSRYDEERPVWEALMAEITSSLGSEMLLEAFLQELHMHSKEPLPKPNTLTLMTIHSAKGKEFDHVYLIGLVEDELPSFQSKKKGDDSAEMEEERRNCFVAITRTIKTLTLSYAGEYRGWSKKPSRFLFEMGLLRDQDAKGRG
jgi:DNA helicase-2/ATP-dependent DNA helicase PcrA